MRPAKCAQILPQPRNVLRHRLKGVNLTLVANKTRGERREVTDIGAHVEYRHSGFERPFHQLDEFSFVCSSPHPSFDSLICPKRYRDSWQRMALEFWGSHVAKNGFREPSLSTNRKRFDSSLEDIQKTHGQISHVLAMQGYGLSLFPASQDDRNDGS